MSFSPEKIRKDFPMYAKEGLYDGLPLVYLDNAATTFKPYSVIQSQDRYYTDITANAHRGDYGLAHAVDVAFEGRERKSPTSSMPCPRRSASLRAIRWDSTKSHSASEGRFPPAMKSFFLWKSMLPMSFLGSTSPK